VPVPFLTAQALGFATGMALCWLVAVLLWKSRDLGSNRVLWIALALVCSLWPMGSFAMQLIVLAGLPKQSTPYAIASVVAWSSTFVTPTFWLRIKELTSRRRIRYRGVLIATSATIAAGLTLGFAAAELVPGFPVDPTTISITSAYNFTAQMALGVAVYGWDQSSAPSRFLARTWPLVALQVGMLLLLIHASLPDAVMLALMFAAQQSTLPTAVLAAAFLAKFRYADVLLKRTLNIMLSVIVAALSLSLVPAFPPGIPFVLACLIGGALLVVSPGMSRTLSEFVDRRLLHRPDYRALGRAFAQESDRVGSETELFALAERRISEALGPDFVRVTPASDVAIPPGIEHVSVSTTNKNYVLTVAPSANGRSLLAEEASFLHAIGRDMGRRLETLQFEHERRERQIREQRLEHSLTDATLKALRAQVDPHFLFNTLNTIADLITSDPATAESMTERLSEFFRYTLSRYERTLATLEEELQFVRHYLEIEQVRFGERLHVELSLEADAAQEMVPALILQPLVENAIRHGLAPRPEGGTIVVSAARDGAFVRLQVADDGVGMREADRGNGIGLQNVRERLRSLYGDAGRITIDSEAARGTCVNMWLPADGR
jgi:two-component system LytT family sensor kinase